MPDINSLTMQPEPKKLVLCFDGTGNEFSGSNADTNVVKLLSKLDRNHPDQFHYYQTGIGTYDINEKSVNKSWFGELQSTFYKTIDQGFGTTFDAHVIAGYRFLMRYYESGAKIYLFGFSRGAFTAKFLARMIHTVGLLCKGNEEMVPFAFRLYQRYLAGDIKDRLEAHQEDSEGDTALIGDDFSHSHDTLVAENEISAFSQTFCRNETVFAEDGHSKHTNIKVYFLGLWDCVNSVAVLEQKTPVPVPVLGTATYIRHAVAIDERRVKFKPALLAQDIKLSDDQTEDIKEVWFPGNHGDVGGGWPSVSDNPLDTKKSMTFWQRVKNLFTSRKPKEASHDLDCDRLQMSDIPLAWMIRELELVGEKDPKAAVKWCHSLAKFKKHFKAKRAYALGAVMHDCLSFGRGSGFFRVLFWKYMEYLPIITRWELTQKGWVDVRFPLNMGSTRDIPPDAVMHQSLVWRLNNDESYSPPNNHGDDLPPCLKINGKVAGFSTKEISDDPNEETFVFAK
ncbi:unnamed protein product [Clonostachys chloroleuca]|uniref:T6SS Phospholipase effector Tle1-like catalytic domain-containing protein n=1 Tax=Clonostachys chloroleuca TaxID=1926264 RepID=A0AA35MF72_9HYPO|nr:unnamed protein product [Clonostachys chloroleuca]